MAASLPSLPPSLKTVQHYLKTATEHDKRDPIVAYYCRLYAFQKGMELDKSSAEGRGFLLALMDMLETEKKTLSEHEAVQSEIVGHAHMENYALKLFLYADNEDRAARFGKNVVKSFYTCGMLFDVLAQFGELGEEIEKNRKYAKWKAAYIHNCLKNGETPHAGPLDEEEYSENAAVGGDPAGPSIGFSDQGPAPPSQPTGYPPANPYGAVPPVVPQQPQVPSYPQAPPAAARPTVPTPAAAAPTPQQPWQPPSNPGNVELSPQEFQKAMKLCRYASSALQYEDSSTAISNLTKALNLLTTGHE